MDERFHSPVSAAVADLGTCELTDESAVAKGRTWSDQWGVPLGRSKEIPGGIVFSISPGEWIVIGQSPPADVVDVTHVKAMFRLSGGGARRILEHLCAIDLSDDMTPNGAAARTLVAGVAAELIREDRKGNPSYVLLISRSFAQHLWDRLVSVAAENG